MLLQDFAKIARPNKRRRELVPTIQGSMDSIRKMDRLRLLLFNLKATTLSNSKSIKLILITKGNHLYLDYLIMYNHPILLRLNLVSNISSSSLLQ
jgi:hypothetical protein